MLIRSPFEVARKKKRQRSHTSDEDFYGVGDGFRLL
jgi:hypothetical protein